MPVTRSQRRTPSPAPDIRGKKGNGEYPTPARVRVFQMRTELGYSAKSVEKETGIPIRTQGYWLRSQNERRTGKNRPERPSKIPGDTLDQIIKDLAGPYSIRKLDYETQIKRYNLNVCVNTLRTALQQQDLRKYRAAQKKWLKISDCQHE